MSMFTAPLSAVRATYLLIPCAFSSLTLVGVTLLLTLLLPVRHLLAQGRSASPAALPFSVEEEGDGWSDAFGGYPVFDAFVTALALTEQGAYIGGAFTEVDGRPVNGVAGWNGRAWEPLGEGVEGGPLTSRVNAIAVHGADVYVGGAFTEAGGLPIAYIARWNGVQWEPLAGGVPGEVKAIEVWRDRVHVAGDFGVRVWSGTAWERLPLLDSDAGVTSMEATDSSLYIAGSFEYLQIEGEQLLFNRIAEWDGAEWRTLGDGLGWSPEAFINAIARSGDALYVVGHFDHAGNQPANGIARWTGSEWEALGDGIFGLATEVAVNDQGVYVAGMSDDYLLRWDGTGWATLPVPDDGHPFALAARGTEVYVGGLTSCMGGFCPYAGILQWNGAYWTSYGATANGGFNDTVSAVALHGADVYVGGRFTQASGRPLPYLARRNGSAWEPLGEGVNGPVRVLLAHAGGVYAGGAFTEAGGQAANHVANWSGTQWETLGAGMNGPVNALAMHGQDLYAGGAFTEAGGVPASHVARWNGASWEPLGEGFPGTVTAIAAGASGVYAGGCAGEGTPTVPCPVAVARWDGTRWEEIAGGFSHPHGFRGVYAIALAGTDVYVGGFFATMNGLEVDNLVKWDGERWEEVGAGLNGAVSALTLHGSDLYVGGGFTRSGDEVVMQLARWDGTTWESLSDGMYGQVFDLAVGNDALYVGGSFIRVGDTASNFFAVREGAVPSGSEPVLDVPSRRPGAVTVYPHPVRDEAAIRFEVPLASEVRLEVFDGLGRRLAVLLAGAHGAGLHEARWETLGVSPGVYYLRLRVGGYPPQTRPVVVAR